MILMNVRAWEGPSAVAGPSVKTRRVHSLASALREPVEMPTQASALQ